MPSYLPGLSPPLSPPLSSTTQDANVDTTAPARNARIHEGMLRGPFRPLQPSAAGSKGRAHSPETRPPSYDRRGPLPMPALLAQRTIAFFALAWCVWGCRFDRRSHDFECSNPTDCEDGRTCVDGWCVPGEGSADAPEDLDAPDGPPGPDANGDAFECPMGCSRCDLTTCVIACDADDSCSGPTVCPEGATCRIECNGRNSCHGAIDCTMAESCRIDCIATDTCGGAIVCGPGLCRVACTGSASCA